MDDSASRIPPEGRRFWALINVVLPFLLGTGSLIVLALYEREANVNFNLFLAFGAIWNLVAVIRAFQIGRR